MTKEEFAKIQDQLFEECRMLRNAGQKEYAGGDRSDAFTNFNKLAVDLNIPREKILWIYAMKHRDGIVAHLNGHVSQREPVEGRIKDLIVYLTLLYGMLVEGNKIDKSIELMQEHYKR